MLFQDWAALARTVLIAPLAYLGLLLVVRLAGKRALAKLNAFDLVVTVALGSVLASVAVSPNVTLASGAAVFVLLLGLQYAIAFMSVRLQAFQRLVKARPTLLVHEGTLLEDTMEEQRVARSEIFQVLRQHGLASVDEAAAVVLETDGTISVIKHPSAVGQRSTLADVAGWV
ncbi:MAG: DUF421 domain-containing protein [Actinomycetota bacterium]|nr:DUF421 domain-containing protein [Actinomycetota bacterium]